jgi:hypothetical protein
MAQFPLSLLRFIAAYIVATLLLLYSIWESGSIASHILNLNGGELLASLPRRFTPEKSAHVTH